MKYNIITAFLALILSPGFGQAQDVKYAQSMIDTLCSPYYGGRGYVNEGVQRAAEFIAKKYEEAGLEPFIQGEYFHPFEMNVNTFPGKVEIMQNESLLETGRDYIVSPDCPTTKAQGSIVVITEAKLTDKKGFKALKKTDWSNHIAVIDMLSKDELVQKRLAKVLKKYKNPVRFQVVKKLTWGVGRSQSDVASFSVLPDVLKDGDMLKIDVEAKLEKGFTSSNVAGMIRGSEVPDSFIFITGHYDHLGHMGSETYIPGANDNASGIAMILDFVKKYSLNPPRYSVVFIAFAGEEAGLVGSYHFVSQLKDFCDPRKIRFVLNMDLMGSGQEGIMVVNGAVFTKEYELIESINQEMNYLPEVKKRGKAANSDHYFFSEVGIPAYFFYLMGPYQHYHDIDDKAENLRLEKQAYDGAFKLLHHFALRLMGQTL